MKVDIFKLIMFIVTTGVLVGCDADTDRIDVKEISDLALLDYDPRTLVAPTAFTENKPSAVDEYSVDMFIGLDFWEYTYYEVVLEGGEVVVKSFKTRVNIYSNNEAVRVGVDAGGLGEVSFPLSRYLSYATQVCGIDSAVITYFQDDDNLISEARCDGVVVGAMAFQRLVNDREASLDSLSVQIEGHSDFQSNRLCFSSRKAFSFFSEKSTQQLNVYTCSDYLIDTRGLTGRVQGPADFEEVLPEEVSEFYFELNANEIGLGFGLYSDALDEDVSVKVNIHPRSFVDTSRYPETFLVTIDAWDDNRISGSALFQEDFFGQGDEAIDFNFEIDLSGFE